MKQFFWYARPELGNRRYRLIGANPRIVLVDRKALASTRSGR